MRGEGHGMHAGRGHGVEGGCMRGMGGGVIDSISIHMMLLPHCMVGIIITREKGKQYYYYKQQTVKPT